MAAQERRPIVSHDVNTLVGFAYERVANALPMSGLIIVPEAWAVGRAVDELEIVLEVMGEGELDKRVLFLPL